MGSHHLGLSYLSTSLLFWHCKDNDKSSNIHAFMIFHSYSWLLFIFSSISIPLFYPTKILFLKRCKFNAFQKQI